MTKRQANARRKQKRPARISSRLPTRMAGVPGLTRDVSADGLFIVQNSRQEIGSQVDLWVDLDTPGGKLKLCCEGTVVRVEEVDGRFGIGLKILSQVIKSEDHPDFQPV
ncbi:MAG: PilZ domain-containing protein [Rhodoferax sp.]